MADSWGEWFDEVLGGTQEAYSSGELFNTKSIGNAIAGGMFLLSGANLLFGKKEDKKPLKNIMGMLISGISFVVLNSKSLRESALNQVQSQIDNARSLE